MKTKVKYIFSVSLVVIILSGVGVFEYYNYVNSSVNLKLQSLQKQVNTLSSSLQKTGNLSQENQALIKNLSNKDTTLVNKSGNQELITAVAEVTPSVVSIVISKDVPKLEVQYDNPFGNDPAFQGIGFQIPVYRQIGTTRKQIGAGSGFLIRSDGYIVTNKHVVSDSSARYTVLLTNGIQKQAKVIYTDGNQDIAILKIDGNNYPTVSFGDSSSLELGQTIAAIGNALGKYSNSVSVGIVSGLNRTVEALDQITGNTEKLTGIIQTDAAINPGNSGGPLLNLSGKVVGVNVATVIGSNNISFSIPINNVKRIITKVLGS